LPDKLPSADELRKLSEELDDLAKQPGRAEDLKKQANEMRERARKLLDQATPQQREELRKLAEQWAKQPHGSSGHQPAPGDSPEAGRGRASPNQGTPTDKPFREERMDLSKANRPDQQRVLADLAPQPPKPGEKEPARATPSSGSTPEAAKVEVQRAADAGERAVEGQAIPARHSDLVRRVFRRMTERAQAKPPETPGSPATNPK